MTVRLRYFHSWMLVGQVLVACSAEPEEPQESDSTSLPLCESALNTLPPFITFVPKGDPEEFPLEVRGTGTVTGRIDVEFTIEIDGCCTFGLQRSRLPDLFEVGEEVAVSVGQNGDSFGDTQWGISVRSSTGALRFFGFAGRFTAARMAAIDAPVAVEFQDLCSSGGTCYDSADLLVAKVSSANDSVSIPARERGRMALEGDTYQVLNYSATRFGLATGNCTDNDQPGEHLYLQLVPEDVELGGSKSGAS